MRKALIIAIALFAVSIAGPAIACPSGYVPCGNYCCPGP